MNLLHLFAPSFDRAFRAAAPAATERFALTHRSVQSLPVGPAQRIRCESGSLWITLDGRTDDVVLAAGECFVAPAGARAVVYALADATVRVTPWREAGLQAAIEGACGRVAQTPPWPGRLMPALSFWSSLRTHGI